MKKVMALFALLAAMSLLTTALAQKQFLTIGTGGVTGVYYPVGGTVARIVNGADTNLRMFVESTGGSVFNIKAMNAGDLDLAVAQSDVVYQAYHGNGDDFGSGVTKLRTIMGLHPEPLHLVCHKDAGVSGFTDIEGKSVNIGNPGSGIRNIVQDLLDVFDMDEDDFTAESVKAAEAPDLLRDGRIDCFFYTVGVGGAAIQDIATTTPIVIVPLDGDRFEDLVDDNDYYAFTTIPAGTYNGVDEPVKVFGVKALFTTTTDLGADEVYAIVKAVLDNFAEFQATHPALKNLTPSDLLTGLGAPLHDGAEKAYIDAGLF